MYTDAELRSPVSFSQWKAALATDPDVAADRWDAYRRAIMGYLKHLKDAHLRASLASAKAYFDGEKSADGSGEVALVIKIDCLSLRMRRRSKRFVNTPSLLVFLRALCAFVVKQIKIKIMIKITITIMITITTLLCS